MNENIIEIFSTVQGEGKYVGCRQGAPAPPPLLETRFWGGPPVCPVAPAIRNAVMQATGVGVNEIPLRPAKLFEYFDKAGLLK